jgi:hypothetical protein
MPFHLHIAGMLTLSALFALGEPTRMLKIPPPVLTSPTNGEVMDNGCQDKSNGVTWDFDWNDVPNATAYHIRVWRNPNLPVVNQMNVATSEYHHDSPQTYIANHNLTGWRWMVRARVGSVWGPWSIVRSFRAERLNTDCQ